MFLADTTEPVRALTAVVSTLDGVTTVLAAFMFFCMAFPDRLKNRPQFYAGFAAVAGIVIVHTLSLIFSGSQGFMIFCSVATGGLQLGAMLMFLFAVGVSPKTIAEGVAQSYEVIRRGETTKETIIPIGGQKKPADGPRVSPAAAKSSAASKVYAYPPVKPVDDDDDDEDQDKGVPLA